MVGHTKWRMVRAARTHAVQDDQACLRALEALWEKARAEIARRAEIVRVGVTLSSLTRATERQL